MSVFGYLEGLALCVDTVDWLRCNQYRKITKKVRFCVLAREI